MVRLGVAAAVLATVLTIWLVLFAAKPHAQFVLWTIAVLYSLFALVVFGFLADLFNAIVGSFTSSTSGGGEVRLPTAAEARALAGALATVPVVVGTMLLWLVMVVFVVGGILGLLLIGWRAIATA